MTPTNTPGNNASIIADNGSSTVFNGNTDNNGDFIDTLIVPYTLNNNQKIYAYSSITVAVTRNNTTGTSQSFTINGSDINWNNDLQQVRLNYTANANGKVTDDQGANVAGDTVRINNANNVLATIITDQNGNYVGLISYKTFENDNTLQFAIDNNNTSITNLIYNFSGDATHNPISTTKTFTDPITVNAVLPIKQMTTYNFTMHVADPLDNVENPTLFFKTAEGTVSSIAPQSNGIYNVSIQTNGNTLKIWQNETGFTKRMYLMPQTKAAQDTNIAQTQDNSGVIDTLTVNNINLLTQQTYTKLKMIANTVDGRDMNSSTMVRILASRLANQTARFMQRAITKLQPRRRTYSGMVQLEQRSIKPIRLSKSSKLTQQVWGLAKNINYQIHYFTSTNDPIYQAAVARQGDNTQFIEYNQEHQQMVFIILLPQMEKSG